MIVIVQLVGSILDWIQMVFDLDQCLVLSANGAASRDNTHIQANGAVIPLKRGRFVVSPLLVKSRTEGEC